jgi:hypothetical protein
MMTEPRFSAYVQRIRARLDQGAFI